ncbi:hypothetical protein CB1_000365011 [Camelus ferus]|nr:hypothetical protein CB1_000365011 [Camelus ferus]
MEKGRNCVENPNNGPANNQAEDAPRFLLGAGGCGDSTDEALAARMRPPGAPGGATANIDFGKWLLPQGLCIPTCKEEEASENLPKALDKVTGCKAVGNRQPALPLKSQQRLDP